MWRCWPRQTAPGARSRDRPRHACSAASATSSATRASSGWARSRWGTCTTCATALLTATGASCRQRPDRRRRRQSAHARLRLPKGVRVSCVSTAFIRAISTAPKACTTSTRSIASQWEVTATVQTISEAHLLPVIEQMLEQFPFDILGFHADNGSEYVNHRVAAMLDKLRIEFTRSRPRHSNDNGLAETKNGAVVRKIFGYGHIPQHHAAHFNTFCVEFLNPFLNFHRPCLFSTDVPDPRKPGRIRRIYRPKDAMTPLDKLASLPDAATFMREGITLEDLRQRACALTDLQAAEELNEARAALFRRVDKRTA